VLAVVAASAALEQLRASPFPAPGYDADGKGGRLTLAWPNGANGARVRIKGAVGGANVVAQCAAP